MKKLLAGLCLLLTFSGHLTAAEVTYYPAARPGAPFSEAVQVGDILFLAGQLGTKNGKLAEGGVVGETRAAMENISAVLQKHGYTLDNVVKCSVFMADMAEWPKMNEVYVTFFKKHLPARSAFGSTGLALDARLEIECIAAK